MPVIHLDDAQPEPRQPFLQARGEAATRYDAKQALLGPRLGLRKLGCNITVVPPGKRAFPAHNHYANDELFLVLQGTGELRMGGERTPLRAGDLVGCPAGGPETAHQIINTGDTELRYLALSSKVEPEIVEYPDSGKFAAIAERPTGPDGTPGRFRFVGREGDAVDYWDGE